MQDTDLINLWKSYDKKLEDSLFLNRKNAEDLTRMKIRSLLSSMQPVKIFTILTGLLWVGFVDTLLIALYPVASPFFLVSAGIQVLLTKLAIGVYLYQLILIQRVDISEPIVDTQAAIARLTATTLWITRLLFLQFPVWTTFYLSANMLRNGPVAFLIIQGVISCLFTWLALWLFFNIKYENRDKNWFGLIFNGKEWDPLLKALSLLSQVEEYKAEGKTD